MRPEIQDMTNLNGNLNGGGGNHQRGQHRVKVLIMGHKSVGKSAVTVRYLTRRYIGEYRSNTEFLYRHSVTFDNVTTDVEILDTSSCEEKGCLREHVDWADAYVVVYSICDRSSFVVAQRCLEYVAKAKGVLRHSTSSSPSSSSSSSVILLGNKRDLEPHARQVGVDDGHEMSLLYRCQFYEVSAAENYVGVSLAFQSLLREARAMQALRTLPVRRKAGPVLSVSKMIGMVFGRSADKSSSNSDGKKKKRPSLSI